jgi:hypothetical protein
MNAPERPVTTFLITIPRALLAIVVSAISGGVLTLFLVDGSATDSLQRFGIGPTLELIGYLSLAWVVGLVIVASGPWTVLHILRYRGWHTAMILGAALTFLMVLAVGTDGFGVMTLEGVSAANDAGPARADGRLAANSWREAVRVAASSSVIGAIVSLIAWRIAYRRAGQAKPR